MKNIYLISSLLLFLALAFSGCDSNESNATSSQDDDTFAQNFGNSVSRDFIGQVVDIDNHPVQNATIAIGTTTVQTDVNGVFIINGANVHERFAYITATKAGYIEGSRAMVPTSGKNNVKIMLLPSVPMETIESGETSEVSIYSGTKVIFDGAFEDEDGNAYTGEVTVSMFHLTPGDEHIEELMPGMLYAQTKTNEEAVLQTYGMLNVELRGSGGQKLNIAEGHTAEITMRIDDDQLATAPNSIPLWYFDQDKGYWKEDGVATKTGNKYVGEVSHFTWWNCDSFASTVVLTVTAVDSNGNPMQNLGVGLTVNATNFNSYIQYTGSNGQISDLIPSNQTLTLNLLDSCGDIIYTTSIGPFANDTVLPTIVITTALSTQTTQIMGSFTTCENSPVSNGYVLLYQNDKMIISALNNGDFQFTTLVCNDSDTFELQGIDSDNIQSTGKIAYNFSLPTTVVTNLQACNSIEEFISFKADNNPTEVIAYDFTTISDHSNQPFMVKGNSTMPALSSLTLYARSVAPGSYTISDPFSEIIVRYNWDHLPNVISLGSVGINSVSGQTCTITINKYGEVGDYIDATFSGSFIQYGILHKVEGILHVKRQ